MAYAHKEGVVHCDLKPANVLFAADGSAKVADFGIAHVSGEMLTRSWHTPAGFVAGTLPYMSPEQTDGVRDDPRLDLYALGAVLYRMLTGRTYLEFDPQETPRAQAKNVARICDEQPLPPSQHNRGVPAWLDGVVLKVLAKRPEERFTSAGQLRAALLQQQPASTPAASHPPPTRLTPARRAADATPSPLRQAPARPAARVAPVARRPSPLPAWFWLAVGAAAVLLVFLIVAVVSLGTGRDGSAVAGAGTAPKVATRPPTHTPKPAIMPTETSAPTSAPTDTPRPTATPPPTPVLPPPTPGPKAPAAGATRTRARDGMVMVYVPAGEFLMGSTDADIDAILARCSDCKREWYTDEQPQHTVYLDAFWIDRTEVTNAQFRKCVEAGACQAPTTCDWGEPTYNDGSKADYPAVCVSWNQAQAYCRWAGVRLPTEAEWEKAARGTDGRTYPWGNQAPDCNRANYWGKDGGCVGRTTAVGSFPTGASPYGALDMAGNVWEWVSDWYDGDYYSRSPARNPTGPDSGQARVLRGGSWDFIWLYSRAALRVNFIPAYRVNGVGFRCGAAAPGG